MAAAGDKVTREVSRDGDTQLNKRIKETCFVTFKSSENADLSETGILPGDGAKLTTGTYSLSNLKTFEINEADKKNTFKKIFVHKIIRRQLNLIFLELGIVTTDLLRAFAMKNDKDNIFYKLMTSTSSVITQNLKVNGALTTYNEVQVGQYLGELRGIWNPTGVPKETQIEIKKVLVKTLKNSKCLCFPEFSSLRSVLTDEWYQFLQDAQSLFNEIMADEAHKICKSLLLINPNITYGGATNAAIVQTNSIIYNRLDTDTDLRKLLIEGTNKFNGLQIKLAFSCPKPCVHTVSVNDGSKSLNISLYDSQQQVSGTTFVNCCLSFFDAVEYKGTKTQVDVYSFDQSLMPIFNDTDKIYYLPIVSAFFSNAINVDIGLLRKCLTEKSWTGDSKFYSVNITHGIFNDFKITDQTSLVYGYAIYAKLNIVNGTKFNEITYAYNNVDSIARDFSAEVIPPPRQQATPIRQAASTTAGGAAANSPLPWDAISPSLPEKFSLNYTYPIDSSTSQSSILFFKNFWSRLVSGNPFFKNYNGMIVGNYVDSQTGGSFMNGDGYWTYNANRKVLILDLENWADQREKANLNFKCYIEINAEDLAAAKQAKATGSVKLPVKWYYSGKDGEFKATCKYSEKQ